MLKKMFTAALLVALTLAASCSREEAEEFAEKAVEKGGQLAEKAAEKGGEYAEKGGELAEKAVEKGGEYAHKAVEKGSELAKKTGALAEQAVDRGGELTDQAIETGGELTDQAIETGGELTDQAIEAGGDGVDYARETAESGADVVEQTTELSDSTIEWLKETAAATPDSVNSLIDKGSQVAGVSREIYSTLATAVDSDTQIEPIYQPIGDADKVDAAINRMGRVEVIDGLSVGFEDMTAWESSTRSSVSGYLVAWRMGEHLVGFVYRSEKKIDMAHIIKETPRLVGLVNAVVD